MSKIKPKAYYKCDICRSEIADRHFKIKKPVSGTKLKKWERMDMCYFCYSEFLGTCLANKMEREGNAK